MIISTILALVSEGTNVIGLQAVDESLDGLLDAMNQMPSFMGNAVGFARVIGATLAMVMGATEAYMMMLGRRGLDVMKLLRIIGFAICISSSGAICAMAKAPGLTFEESAKSQASQEMQGVIQKESEVQQKQAELLKRLNDVMAEQFKAVKMTSDDASFLELDKHLAMVVEWITNQLKSASLSIETTVCQWISTIARWIATIVFQIAYYGMLVAQRICLAILAVFCPIAFAMSLAPVFKNAWVQWLSKFLAVSLWGWVAYIIIFYVASILTYNLSQDLDAYQAMINSVPSGEGVTWESIGTIGMQGLGSTCMYIVGLLIGAKLLTMVPEVAGWLIPGGVSAGIGGSMTSMATGMVGTAAAGGLMAVRGGRHALGKIPAQSAAARAADGLAARNANS